MPKNDVTIKVGADTKQLNKQLDVAKSKISSLKGPLLGLAAGAVSFVGITSAIKKSVAAYRVQEKAINALNQSLKTQGIYTDALSKKYQANASALQKVTTFGDEAIIGAQSLLQNYIGQLEVTPELTKSILDFATAQKIDLKSAADLVGKSIGSSTNALTRYGIEVDTSGTKAQKMVAIQEALNKKFAGQAEAAASGLGALEQTSNAFGDLLEVVGQKLAPTIENFANRLTDLFSKMGDATTEEGKAFRDFIDVLVVAFKALAFVVNVVAKAIGAIVSKISNLVKGFKSIIEEMGGALRSFGEAIGVVSKKAQAAEITPEIDTEKTQNQMQEEVKILTDAEKKKLEEKQKAAERSAALDERIKQLELERQMEFNEEEKKLLKEHLMTMDEIDSAARNEAILAEAGAFDKRLLNRRKFNKIFAVLEDERTKALVGGTIETGKALFAAAGSSSSKLFKLAKNFSIAEATINTFKAASEALKNPPGPPFTLPLAAAAVATGLGQVQTIKSQQMPAAQGGGIVPESPGTARDRTPMLLEPGELIVPKALTPNFTQTAGVPTNDNTGGQRDVNVMIGFTPDAAGVLKQEEFNGQQLGVIRP